MRERPESKAGRLRAADKLLRRLLRTPKTRAGLIAAVTATSQVSRNFVYGWLSENTHNGSVVESRIPGQRPTYQIAEQAVLNTPTSGTFPSWLEPRQLPTPSSREVFISGQPTKTRKV